MPAKKPKPKKKPASREKPVKIEGTFNELIAKSVSAKKPKAGWPKAPR